VAPKNTPVEIINMLNKEINAGLADPKLKARFADLGAETVPGSPADFGRFIAEETEKWSKAVRFAGIRADQQPEPVRRIGVLVLAAENDFMQRDATLAFREELRKLGWIEGDNLQIDLRFGTGDSGRTLPYAQELISLGADVIVTGFQSATAAAQRQTQTIPIIFAGVGDPSADRTVRDIARPEGNTTGFTNLNASFGGKWIELLKEVVPGVARIGLIAEAGAQSSAYIPAIEAAARSLGVSTIMLPISNAAEIEPTLRAFALEPKGALIVLPDASAIAPRELIRLAAEYRLPAAPMQLAPKRLQSLRELVPKGGKIAALLNPASMDEAEALIRVGLPLLTITAEAESDFEPAFIQGAQQGVEALLVTADPFLNSRRAQIVALAARHSLPAAYPWREYVEAGGLMSYGTSLTGTFRQIGQYVSRVLKGDKPADLPVQNPTKFELAINLKTAKALGIIIPETLLAAADEVIE
jgi:ABC-type uncharacterized transport system substrate-binding protein